MNFIKSTLAVAVLTSATFGAQAAIIDLGDVTGAPGFGYSSNGTGLFADTINFSLSSAQGVNAVLFNFSFSNPSNVISNFWATLSEESFGVIGATNITNNFETGSWVLGAGNYSVSLSGDYGYYGTYDLDAVLAPVPEPSTLGLMFGGLGLVGLIAYRSRKAAV